MKKVMLFLSLILIVFLNYIFLSAIQQQDSDEFKIQQKRTALIIGNANYKTSQLKNSVNDAKDIASVLQKKGFDVTLLLDANRRTMENSIRDFGKRLNKGGVGLFYFAGHGMQVNGSNYLIPVNSNIEMEDEVQFESVNAGRILNKMESAGNELNIVILDACRDNPFISNSRSGTKGLAEINAPTGSYIVYATAPGKTAADGDGRNGVFTKHFIQNINVPGLKIEELMKKVREGVNSETNGVQIPWGHSSIMGDFYFTPTSGINNITTSSIQIKKTIKTSPSLKRTNNLFTEKNNPLLLRAIKKTISENEAKSIIIKKRFFEISWNGLQNINNKLESVIILNKQVIEDNKYKLMWHQAGSKIMSYENALDWIDKLNRNSYGSYSDWRLPTLEEAASLLRKNKTVEGLHIDKLFSKKQLKIWTQDETRTRDIWIVDFENGFVGRYSKNTLNYVRPVRKI